MGRGLTEKTLVSFNAGELSPRLDARSDLEKVSSGCRILENFIIETYGSARRRPGTQFMALVRAGDPPDEPEGGGGGEDTPSDEILAGEALSLAVASDGKVYVGGDAFTFGGASVGSSLVRLNADGSYDDTFSTTAFAHPVNWLFIQPSGKIIVATAETGLTAAESIMRLNTDGTQDETFVPDESIVDIAGVAMLSDGRLGVVFGQATYYGTLAILTLDGALDTGFDPAFDPVCYAPIAAAGTNLIVRWLNDDPGVMDRISDTGAILTHYAWDGGQPTAMSAQSDGRVIVAGYPSGGDAGVGGTTGGIIRNFSNAGALIDGFSVSDESTIGIPTSAIATSGIFYVLAITQETELRKITGTGGTVGTFAPSFDADPICIALAADGSLWVGGNWTQVNGFNRSCVVKFDSNGNLLT